MKLKLILIFTVCFETIGYYFFNGEASFLFSDTTITKDWWVDIEMSFVIPIVLCAMLYESNGYRYAALVTGLFYFGRMIFFCLFYFDLKAIPLLALYVSVMFFTLFNFKGKWQKL